MKDLQVITGCMFAGKTTELINRLKATNQNYLLVKPIIDNRDSGNQVLTHDGLAENAMRVSNVSDIFHKLESIQVVGIDEGQFFNSNIVNDVTYLQTQNIQVIIAGLEKDYLNQPFGFMTQIVSMADSITRLTANCNRCQNQATHSYRKNTMLMDQFLVGNENFYEALCEPCFNKNM